MARQRELSIWDLNELDEIPNAEAQIVVQRGTRESPRNPERTEVSNLVGPKGDKGDPGNKGDKGDIGPSGDSVAGDSLGSLIWCSEFLPTDLNDIELDEQNHLMVEWNHHDENWPSPFGHGVFTPGIPPNHRTIGLWIRVERLDEEGNIIRDYGAIFYAYNQLYEPERSFRADDVGSQITVNTLNQNVSGGALEYHPVHYLKAGPIRNGTNGYYERTRVAIYEAQVVGPQGEQGPPGDAAVQGNTVGNLVFQSGDLNLEAVNDDTLNANPEWNVFEGYSLHETSEIISVNPPESRDYYHPIFPKLVSDNFIIGYWIFSEQFIDGSWIRKASIFVPFGSSTEYNLVTTYHNDLPQVYVTFEIKKTSGDSYLNVDSFLDILSINGSGITDDLIPNLRSRLSIYEARNVASKESIVELLGGNSVGELAFRSGEIPFETVYSNQQAVPINWNVEDENHELDPDNSNPVLLENPIDKYTIGHWVFAEQLINDVWERISSLFIPFGFTQWVSNEAFYSIIGCTSNGVPVRTFAILVRRSNTNSPYHKILSLNGFGGNAFSPSAIPGLHVRLSIHEALVAGAKGEPGAKGLPGQRGQQGPKGDKGDKGPKGDTGDRGPKGQKGDKGDKGDRGLKGDKGDKGDKGEQGDTAPDAENTILAFDGLPDPELFDLGRIILNKENDNYYELSIGLSNGSVEGYIGEHQQGSSFDIKGIQGLSNNTTYGRFSHNPNHALGAIKSYSLGTVQIFIKKSSFEEIKGSAVELSDPVTLNVSSEDNSDSIVLYYEGSGADEIVNGIRYLAFSATRNPNTEDLFIVSDLDTETFISISVLYENSILFTHEAGKDWTLIQDISDLDVEKRAIEVFEKLPDVDFITKENIPDGKIILVDGRLYQLNRPASELGRVYFNSVHYDVTDPYINDRQVYDGASFSGIGILPDLGDFENNPNWEIGAVAIDGLTNIFTVMLNRDIYRKVQGRNESDSDIIDIVIGIEGDSENNNSVSLVRDDHFDDNFFDRYLDPQNWHFIGFSANIMADDLEQFALKRASSEDRLYIEGIVRNGNSIFSTNIDDPSWTVISLRQVVANSKEIDSVRKHHLNDVSSIQSQLDSIRLIASNPGTLDLDAVEVSEMPDPDTYEHEFIRLSEDQSVTIGNWTGIKWRAGVYQKTAKTPRPNHPNDLSYVKIKAELSNNWRGASYGYLATTQQPTSLPTYYDNNVGDFGQILNGDTVARFRQFVDHVHGGFKYEMMVKLADYFEYLVRVNETLGNDPFDSNTRPNLGGSANYSEDFQGTIIRLSDGMSFTTPTYEAFEAYSRFTGDVDNGRGSISIIDGIEYIHLVASWSENILTDDGEYLVGLTKAYGTDHLFQIGISNEWKRIDRFHHVISSLEKEVYDLESRVISIESRLTALEGS